MKSYFIAVMIFVTFCSLMILFSIKNHQKEIVKNQEIILNKLDSIHQSDTAYIKQITLFREHYSTCSFITRDDIRIGHNGYLQYIAKTP